MNKQGDKIMKKKALTLTVVANMTSNYSEGLGNIASVQSINYKKQRKFKKCNNGSKWNV